jgi:hypothetical protein
VRGEEEGGRVVAERILEVVHLDELGARHTNATVVLVAMRPLDQNAPAAGRQALDEIAVAARQARGGTERDSGRRARNDPSGFRSDETRDRDSRPFEQLRDVGEVPPDPSSSCGMSAKYRLASLIASHTPRASVEPPRSV